jgi:muconate cycloisomerase
MHRVRIPFKSIFSHALWRNRGETQAIILVLESDTGHIGLGEILPRAYLTGETLETVSRAELPCLVQRWLGRTFVDREQIVASLCADLPNAGCALATFAGWELAVLDLAGKVFGFGAGEVLGSHEGPDLEESAVIDFGVTTPLLEKYCILLRIAGYRHVKLKVGLNDDLRRIEIVRDILGPEAQLRVDANGAWTEDQAIAILHQMRRFSIRSVEQPVQASDLRGMRRVREATGMAVVADESLCNFGDAQSLIAEHAADYFNIRIGKCGGLLACLQLATLAREAGVRCDLGSLVGETGILSRAAEIFGTHVEGFEFLEGKHQNQRLLVQDIVESPLKGRHAGNGLGIRLLSNHLARWAAPAAITIFETPQGAHA